MSYIDASKLQYKALTLIERHLDKLLDQGDVAMASAIVIQNYAKTLVMVAKDQRDAMRGFNPSALTDEELDKLVKEAESQANENTDSPD